MDSCRSLSNKCRMAKPLRWRALKPIMLCRAGITEIVRIVWPEAIIYQSTYMGFTRISKRARDPLFDYFTTVDMSPPHPLERTGGGMGDTAGGGWSTLAGGRGWREGTEKKTELLIWTLVKLYSHAEPECEANTIILCHLDLAGPPAATGTETTHDRIVSACINKRNRPTQEAQQVLTSCVLGTQAHKAGPACKKSICWWAVLDHVSYNSHHGPTKL